MFIMGFPGGSSDSKESAHSVGDLGSIPASGTLGWEMLLLQFKPTPADTPGPGKTDSPHLLLTPGL